MRLPHRGALRDVFLRPLIPPPVVRSPPQKGQTLIDGAASSLVERAAGTSLGRKLWSSPA
eukprot:scaffold110954_cov29-Phaeocystis_antarctica.AAC.1